VLGEAAQRVIEHTFPLIEPMNALSVTLLWSHCSPCQDISVSADSQQLELLPDSDPNVLRLLLHERIPTPERRLPSVCDLYPVHAAIEIPPG